MTAIALTGTGKHTSITITDANPAQAKEAAIALALSQTIAGVITDSQQAYRNFSSGRIHTTTLKVLNQRPLARPVTLIWVPAHQGIPGNEPAHLTARELSRRATAAEAEPERMHALVSYSEITENYNLTRQTFPTTHKCLSREQERIFRSLQVNTFPHPTRNHLICPIHCPHYAALARPPGLSGT